jgi:DNA helicase-2/ATP-dependent DNA helicase PcrA
LALTFTNKAAAEMRNRVESLVPTELNRVRLTTFHSYAAELLQQHGSHLGLRPDFQILSNDIDREALLNDVLGWLRKDLTHSLPESFNADSLLPVVNQLQEQCISNEEMEKYLLGQSNVINAAPLFRVYIAYKDALISTNTLDFPSLIAESIELLNIHKFLAKNIRKVYKYILIDEFQDTNLSQYKFITLITNPDPTTLFVVADDDQMIYQWNGASHERLISLKSEFKMSQLQLPENYRCPSLVTKLANSLIENNSDRYFVKNQLLAINNNNNIVRLFRFDTLYNEAEWIANDIKNTELQDRAGCAVLARTKRLLDIIGHKLDDVGVPVYYAVRKDEFKSAPLRMLHAILRLVNLPSDKRSLLRLSKAFHELEGINIEPASVLARTSADNNNMLYSWLSEVLLNKNLSIKSRQLLSFDIKPLLNSLNYRDFANKLFDWAETFQNKSQGDELDFNEFEQERNTWKILQNEILKKFEGEQIGLHQLLHELDLTSKTPPKPPEAVPCFTIHASKGMEFRHVYLMGLVEDQLPIWAAVKKGDNSLEMQEERRNCFVAITRVQDRLTLSFSKNVFGWPKQPSRFLTEMGFKL